MNQLIKSSDFNIKYFYKLFIASLILCVPVFLLSENLVYALPVLLIIILANIFGERVLFVVILISLFTLVGEVNRTLRILVYIFDFSLLGYFFLKKYGLFIKSYPKIPNSVWYFVILYFSTMIISSIMSKYPFAGVGIILQQTAFFIITYIFYSLLNNYLDIKTNFIGIYIVAAIIVTFSLLAFFTEGFSLLEIISPNRPRVSAITGNIEASTNFLVVSIPIIIGSALLKQKYSEKKTEYFLLVYFSVGMLLMMSRSAIIGIIFSLAIIFYLLRRKRFYQLILSVIFLVLMFTFYEPLNALLTTLFRIESGMSARDYLWQLSVDMIKDNMVFGVGPGVYKYEMLNYFPYLLSDWWGRFIIYLSEVSGGVNISHNFFLTFFTEMGILGILTAIALPIVYFRIGIKTLLKYKKESGETYYFVVSLFAAGSSIILRNFFNGIGLLYVGGIQTDLPFWLIFGSLIYFYRLPLGQDPTSIGNT